MNRTRAFAIVSAIVCCVVRGGVVTVQVSVNIPDPPAAFSPIPAVPTVPGPLTVPGGAAGLAVASEKKPPEPPATEAAEPKRLVRYFCRMWKDEEWEKMWWAMSPQYRKKVSLKKFTALFTDDAEMNGGLSDENIVAQAETNAGIGVKVELIFKFKRARHRVVKAEVQRILGGQYRLVSSAIIPMDLNDL